MTRNVQQYRLRNRFNPLKMAKTKSVMLLLMIITACALIFSLSDAYPTPEELDKQVQNAGGYNNTESSTSWDYEGSSSPGSVAGPKDPKLVITHVVKTLEFEVDEVDSDENSTETTEKVIDYEETDIKLLDVNLLRELVNKTPLNGPSTESDKRWKRSAEKSKESVEDEGKTKESKRESSSEGGGEDDEDEDES